MGLFSFFGRGPKNNLTSAEISLLDSINFQQELIAELKVLAQSELKQLPTINAETGDILDGFFAGVYCSTTEEKAIEYVKKLKSKFREQGYLIFVFDGKGDQANVAVIKGTDDLDILRYRRTDAVNYDLENEDIVQKIAEWRERYGLIVLGCSTDWLQIEFEQLPKDLYKFAEEVYEFCPDSVDQGVETIDNLTEAIQEMHGIWLWWD